MASLSKNIQKICKNMQKHVSMKCVCKICSSMHASRPNQVQAAGPGRHFTAAA